MEYVKDRELFSNPYIIQMDRFAESLKHLSETFLYLEDYKGSFTKDEIEEMFRRVSERVCTNCEKRNWCLCENRIQTCQMVCEILCTAEEFGAELNVEIKRKLQKKCDRAPRFLRETLEVFGDAKQKLLWNNRIVQNREGCARSRSRDLFGRTVGKEDCQSTEKGRDTGNQQCVLYDKRGKM